MKLKNVNTADLRSAIELGCETMQKVFNADDRGFPFFKSVVRPEAYLAFHNIHGESHVPGRHLNALLTAESVAGIAVREDAIEKHAQAAKFSFSGPLPLPLNREAPGGPLANFTEHNLREGLHALYALSRYRYSEWARSMAEQCIEAMLHLWDPERGWDKAAFAKAGIRWTRDDTFIVGAARAIGPLVKYFRATSYGPALDLALLLKEKAVTDFFHPDGAYDRNRFGTHTHSTTCVMSSLAQLADLTQDAALMERVRAFYDNGLWQIRDELGWVIENSADSANPDRGEGNNTGDIVETALILGKWGYARYFHDAERILRGHLLPSQLRDNSFIKERPNPDSSDGKRDVAGRHLGAFGFPAPYGHEPVGATEISFNMDIVGGAVASICQAFSEATQSSATGHRVNLLFDHDTAGLKVSRLPANAGVEIVVKTPGALSVRVPPWASVVRVAEAGAGKRWRITGGYLLMPDPPLRQPICLHYEEVPSEIGLKHRTRNIRVRLSGDRVIGMDNFGADLTYFDPISG